MQGHFDDFKVVKYSKEYYEQWNDFVAKSKNGTFLFHRDFMEYHSDRFEDFSLLIFQRNKLQAILPANKSGQEIYSHQGLTYGGVLLPNNISVVKVFSVFEVIQKYCKQINISKITIREIPEFYCDKPTSEISFIIGQKYSLFQRQMVLAIDFEKGFSIHKTKLKHYKKGRDVGFEIKEDDTFDEFWINVLQPRLLERFNSKPVHRLEEITLLKRNFPKNIKQFNIYLGNQILAGITIFENKNVVKSQYGATTSEGERFRALDYLFLFLIDKYKEEGKKFFSMGTISDNSIKGYNEGLLKQKEEFGCNVYLQDSFSIDL
ncbi:FemAB family protein [Aestuariibaculum lutulentum]|uniref:FemAB family protein n=1 Tax=Aestuariibaculum lutulentum TaxID=2920935 RepID=A0ABS9REH6_9FLAO|nr:FemAB family protein [Aestuariibaculum lutulentum]MCH4551354.1 FemAB family protein [Aestuariibaculum lutulentum]